MDIWFLLTLALLYIYQPREEREADKCSIIHHQLHEYYTSSLFLSRFQAIIEITKYSGPFETPRLLA